MRRCWTLQESMDAAVVCVTGRLSSQGLKVIHELLEAEHPGRRNAALLLQLLLDVPDSRALLGCCRHHGRSALCVWS